MLTSTTRDGAREEVGLSPAVDDGLVVDVLDYTVCSTGKLHLQYGKSDHGVTTKSLHYFVSTEKYYITARISFYNNTPKG